MERMKKEPEKVLKCSLVAGDTGASAVVVLLVVVFVDKSELVKHGAMLILNYEAKYKDHLDSHCYFESNQGVNRYYDYALEDYHANRHRLCL